MSFTDSYLETAHKHSSQNRIEIETSELCACVYCRETFAGEDVTYWIPDEGGDTAVCPFCPVDCVLGSASGLPVEDPVFLTAMHNYWFERTVNAQD